MTTFLAHIRFIRPFNGCQIFKTGQIILKLSVKFYRIHTNKVNTFAHRAKILSIIQLCGLSVYTYNDIYHADAGIPAGQKFDCIFFNDVLEHMAQPEKALELASTMLTKEGHIIASIPNMRFYPVILSLLRYKDFQYQDSGVMDKTHLRFFTAKSMVRLFEESGYKVEKIEGINRCDDFKYLNILNILLFNRISDMKYLQFAVVAQLK